MNMVHFNVKTDVSADRKSMACFTILQLEINGKSFHLYVLEIRDKMSSIAKMPSL